MKTYIVMASIAKPSHATGQGVKGRSPLHAAGVIPAQAGIQGDMQGKENFQ